MKISIIFNSAGDLVGIARPGHPAEKGEKKEAQIESGIVAEPGQTVREVDVPERLLQLEGPELLKKLLDHEAVKKELSTLVTAGPGP